uniref:Uncharacterized protein n=1 Tax=Homalodisca liturata TaxID=320908 RepID=A0A1B6HSK5_9HEMI
MNSLTKIHLFTFIFTICFFKVCILEMTDMKEYSDKILSIYKDPSSSTLSKLLMYAFFYLDEMFKLEEGIEEGKEECKTFLRQFHAEGGPKHINNIPLGRLMEVMKLKSSDIAEIENVIEKTKKSWSDLQEVLSELKPENGDLNSP